jgi:hypothetical protein
LKNLAGCVNHYFQMPVFGFYWNVLPSLTEGADSEEAGYTIRATFVARVFRPGAFFSAVA